MIPEQAARLIAAVERVATALELGEATSNNNYADLMAHFQRLADDNKAKWGAYHDRLDRIERRHEEQHGGHNDGYAANGCNDREARS